jgi:hypothetical protein
MLNLKEIVWRRSRFASATGSLVLDRELREKARQKLPMRVWSGGRFRRP